MKRLSSGSLARLPFALGVITAIPLLLGQRLWLEIWRGVRPHSWDGSGHFAIASIYDRSIFPDTFGWTNAYFSGMPFPNFYPPLYYWTISALHHTQLLSFESAFKLVTVIPVLLLPAAIGVLGWKISGKSRLAAIGAALASVAIMVDSRFLPFFPSGLDYFSTFQIGLYTQPLGFLLLILWLTAYLEAHSSPARFLASCLLLAMTILANFFNATTAIIFIAALLVNDLGQYLKKPDTEKVDEDRRILIAHLAGPLIAAALASFWLVPMLNQYEYLVTRPHVIESGKLLSPALWGWYAVALVGALIWWRRPSPAAYTYLVTCLALALGVILASTIAPRWFPLQSSRFLATLNFLLAIPVGQALAAAFRYLARLLGEAKAGDQTLSVRRLRYTLGATVIFLLLLCITSPGPRWAYAFYAEGTDTNISGVLDFAHQHRDGRYLVEVVNPTFTNESFDARALNSYLGAQGNETLSVVFHEASPTALFSLPVVNSFSDYPDSFGISSVLSDDLDFAEQPLSKHIERARLLGVRYLVIRTPRMKEQVAREASVIARHDFDWWSVFELQSEPLPRVRTLPFKPALVVSSFTLKERRRNEISFIRLAEEQFAEGWFDVLLARSPENKIDRLEDLDKFGALILDAYEYDDEEAAFEKLRDYAQHRPVVLLSSDSPLFHRIQASKGEIPLALVIQRSSEAAGEVLDAIKPSHRYQQNVIREQWRSIRRILEETEVLAGSMNSRFRYEMGQTSLQLSHDGSKLAEAVPVLIDVTYHPNWRRRDGSNVYAATPFNMLTFVGQPASLNYERSWIERASAWFSAGAFVILLLLTIYRVKRAPVQQ